MPIPGCLACFPMSMLVEKKTQGPRLALILLSGSGTTGVMALSHGLRQIKLIRALKHEEP